MKGNIAISAREIFWYSFIFLLLVGGFLLLGKYSWIIPCGLTPYWLWNMNDNGSVTLK